MYMKLVIWLEMSGIFGRVSRSPPTSFAQRGPRRVSIRVQEQPLSLDSTDELSEAADPEAAYLEAACPGSASLGLAYSDSEAVNWEAEQ